MGALAAFLGGAGGAGLTDMTRRWDRNDEMAQQQAQRQQEMAEQRAFREEQAALDRAARFGAGGGSAVSRPRGGGGGDPEAAQSNRRDVAVSHLRSKFGLSGPEAEAQVDGSNAGVNINKRSVQRSESFDDGDRQKNITTTQEEPDVEKYLAMNKEIGFAFANADSNARSNSDQRAKARQTDAETAAAVRGGDGDLSGARTSLLLKGKGEYDADGSSVLVPGAPPKGSLASAKVGTEGSKQNENNAQAGKANADVKKLRGDVSGDLKTQNPERLTTTLNAINGLIRTYDEKTVDEATVKDRKELQAMAGQIARELQRRGLGAGAADKPAAPAPPAPAARAPALEAPRDVTKRKVGQTYQTPRGLMIWRGNGWEAV